MAKIDQQDANESFHSRIAKLSEHQLLEILDAHKKWLASEDHTQWLEASHENKEKYKNGRANLFRADLGKANLSGANLRDANLTFADLSGADLSGADLRDAILTFADLSGVADLRGADLRGVDLSHANLRDTKLNWGDLRKAGLSGAHLNNADLREADLRGAYLGEADLSGADLREADLSGAILNGAILSGAKLVETKMPGAKLDNARFLRADLTNASLVGAEVTEEVLKKQVERADGDTEYELHAEKIKLPDATVASTNFGMSNLTSTQLPASLNEFRDTLKNVEEISKNARTIYFSMIALCAFVLLTVAATTDAQLILDNIRLKLPIINAEVSVVLFYICAPTLALLVFFYLHMYLAHLWELAAWLPAIFPDGLPLRRKLYPWLINFLIEHWQNTEDTSWFEFRKHRVCAAIALGWAMVPLTIMGAAYRLFARQDALYSYLLLFLVALSVFVASARYEYARAMVRHADVGWRRFLPFVISVFVLLTGLYGTHEGLNGNLPFTTPNIVLRNEDLSGRVMSGLKLERANLSFAKLVKADLRKANLTNADLRGADLTSADLDHANLRDADLLNATLTRVELLRGNLQEAKLGRANLQEAFMFEANLQQANLGGADLRNAHLGNANLQGANLGGANLQDAGLNSANLQGAALDDANLQGADFRHLYLDRGPKTRGLTQSTIKSGKNWKLAYYPDEFLEQLGLPKNHNEKLPEKLSEVVKIEKRGQ
jgi:uncharacterized protein YjbI with pentapeptide repeats